MGICRERRARERMSHIPFVVKYYIHSVSEGQRGGMSEARACREFRQICLEIQPYG